MKSILVTGAAGFIGANLASLPPPSADSTALESDFGFTPKITLREGYPEFHC